jgi:hypothetical protein
LLAGILEYPRKKGHAKSKLSRNWYASLIQPGSETTAECVSSQLSDAGGIRSPSEVSAAQAPLKIHE